ncbi:MAG TPA: proline--tRNA ligase, partial [Alphaproteobacteria bacterium]|nr:proline--tRNA ligase [Alphaproteobacteria bacterium]
MAAISPTRSENYPEWYQSVVKAADMAELSGVRGCMVIKPWGYAIWERIQKVLDGMIKETGHENCYFPVFIPLSYFQKEATHVDGFAKEMAVVTHHRLIMKDGKLVPDPESELEEPLIVRPTSETIIGEAMARQIQSYRDLPLLWNQWANVVRWEMRTRLFLRTAEFLWQEGHTAHANEQDARAETYTILEVYRALIEDYMAIPVVLGEKSAGERFPGAVTSLCLEAMMQDGRALQAGTSHYLGQNFARAANIQFQSPEGKLELAHTTSWGVSTRLIGGLIMTHADDDGLVLPPKLAPEQIVIVPILRDEARRAEVMDYCERLTRDLSAKTFAGENIRVRFDQRDMEAADKRWGWVKKGVPIVLEVGPKDIEKKCVAVMRRDDLAAKKTFPLRDEFVAGAVALLEEIQTGIFARAAAMRDA